MKIYLAAPYAGRDILRDELQTWTDAGHEVTCGWVWEEATLDASSYGISESSIDDEVRTYAERDLADIDRADALIHYTAQYLQSLDPSLGDVTHNLHSGGRHVETGYALAKEKIVVVLGPQENIFQRGLCMTAYDIDEALQCLEMTKNLIWKEA